MLRSRAAEATIWSGADVLLRQAVQFGVTVALARLLTPEDFGTIALLYLFTGIATTLADGGLSSALVQRQDVTHTDESTVFWINLAMGAAMAAGLVASARAFARLYSLPILAPLTAVLAVSVFMGALGSIHATLFRKRLDFQTPTKVNVVATAAAGGLAVLLAWRGFGVWTLAAQTLAATSITTALYWTFSRWRPTVEFSAAAARRLFGFGGFVLTSSLMEAIYSRIYTLLIGKFYGVRDLGFYNRADGTKGVAADTLSGILMRVALPVFSASAHDAGRLRRGVRLALRGIMLVNIPAMLGMAALAGPFIVTLFGEAWRPAVPVLRVLCLAGVLWPLHVVNLNALLAQGYSPLYFRVEIAKKALGILLLAVGCWFGMMGIAWSQVIFGVLAFAINAHYTGRFLGYGPMDQVRDCLPIIGAAAPMAAAVYWLGSHLDLAPWLELSGLAAFGGAVYLLVGWGFRLAALKDAVVLVRGLRESVAAS